MTALAHPDQLITAAELEPLLGTDNLRVFDCTTYLLYETGTGRPYTVKSGAEDYAAGHIPHSAFIDLQGQLSIEDSPYLLIGFEDLLNGGDRDFNDLLFAVDIGVQNVQALVPTPEPSLIVLALLLGGIAFVIKRREDARNLSMPCAA